MNSEQGQNLGATMKEIEGSHLKRCYQKISELQGLLFSSNNDRDKAMRHAHDLQVKINETEHKPQEEWKKGDAVYISNPDGLTLSYAFSELDKVHECVKVIHEEGVMVVRCDIGLCVFNLGMCSNPITEAQAKERENAAQLMIENAMHLTGFDYTKEYDVEFAKALYDAGYRLR